MSRQRPDVIQMQKEIDAMPNSEKKEAAQGCVDVIKEADELKERYDKMKEEMGDDAPYVRFLEG